MRDGGHEAPRTARRQLCIGIERNHVADGQRQFARAFEIAVMTSAQEPVQLSDLAALAFLANPAPFGFRPYPVAMKEYESVGLITGVEVFNAAQDGCHQVSITRQHGSRCVCEIRKQTEAHVLIRVSQIAHFQLFHLFAHHLQTAQHHGHHYQGGVLFRDALFKIELGQGFRCERPDNHGIHDLNGQFAEREKRERPQHGQRGGVAHTHCQREAYGNGEKAERKTNHTGQIENRGPGAQETHHPDSQRNVCPQSLLKTVEAFR